MLVVKWKDILFCLTRQQSPSINRSASLNYVGNIEVSQLMYMFFSTVKCSFELVFSCDFSYLFLPCKLKPQIGSGYD